MGCYLNHADQGERLRDLLKIVPPAAQNVNLRTKRTFRRLEPDRVAELLVAYEGGVSINDLAEQFGLHRSTVLDHLNRSPARRRYPALDKHGVAVTIELYHNGLSLRDVGLTLGVHASTVRLALSKAGTAIRTRNGWPQG